MSEPNLDKCPKCKEENLDTPAPKKLISKSSFQLIGSGWASDNYK